MQQTQPKRVGRAVRTAVALIATGSLLAACAPAAPGDNGEEPVETVTVKLSSPFPTTNAIGRLIDWWLADVGGQLESEGVEFEYFPAAALLTLSDSLPGVTDGRVEAAYIAESFSLDRMPIWGATAIPFQTDNVEASVRSQVELYENDERFRNAFRDAGVEVLFFAPINAGIWALNDPIESLSEMDGLRLRSSGRVAVAEAALGIDPIFMDPSEVYESLNTGVVDGASTFPLDNAVTFGLQEVAPNFVNSGYGIFTQGAIVMNAEVYDSLPQAARDIIESVRSGDAITQAWQIQQDSEEIGCTNLLEGGGNLYTVPESETEEWRDSVWDELVDVWKGQVNETDYQPAGGRSVDEDLDDFLETWQSTVATNTASAEYEPGLPACQARQ